MPPKTPRKPRTMLRRILSHHEIATLLLLLHAPIEVGGKPEIPLLEEAGLVETVSTGSGTARFQLTPDGNAVLRRLGVS
ncbi:MAG TPA: hypothetical protein VGZ01_08725 [Trinickia sp.]|nr:hypothetical protein [Trinickia sp.]